MTTIIDGSGSATFATPLPMAQVADLGLPAFGRVVRTAGNLTTTSTSLVDVTGATVTITTGAFPVAYGTAQTSYNDGANQNVYSNVAIDGVLQHGTSGMVGNSATNIRHNLSISGQSAALSAGSHTIKQQWAVSGNTGTINADATYNHTFYVREIR